MTNVLGTLFGDIAKAIRNKTGETDSVKMKPAEFPEKIAAIETGADYNLALAETMMHRDAKYLSDKSSILDLKDFVGSDGDTLASLTSYSFAGFTSLEYMRVTDVFMFNSHALYGNSKLKILDITVPPHPFNATTFYPNALGGCTALESIIIRPGKDGIMGVSFQHAATSGGSSTFYVYIPGEYYDAAVANATSEVPADRYRKLEDYPEIDNWFDTY